MTEADVETVLPRARENFSEAKARTQRQLYWQGTESRH